MDNTIKEIFDSIDRMLVVINGGQVGTTSDDFGYTTINKNEFVTGNYKKETYVSKGVWKKEEVEATGMSPAELIKAIEKIKLEESESKKELTVELKGLKDVEETINKILLERIERISKKKEKISVLNII